MPERVPAMSRIDDFDGILANLECQRDCYDTLLALSERERAAIASADLPQLAQIITDKERIVARVLALEAERRDASERFARQHALAAALTISQLRQHAPPASSARLQAASIALSDRLARLRRLNTSNAQLINQVRQLGQQRLEAALRYASHPLYDQRGDQTAAHPPGSIICDYRA